MFVLFLLGIFAILYGLLSNTADGRDMLWELHTAYFRLHGVHDVVRDEQWERRQTIASRGALVAGTGLLVLGVLRDFRIQKRANR